MSGPDLADEASATTPDGPPLTRGVLLLLASATLFVVGLALLPLTTFALFGSDTGEYFRLSSDLAAYGHLPTSGYAGWGFAYPDFPGLFVLTAAAAGAGNVGVLAALEVVVPVTAALGILPLFLLFRQLVRSPAIALLGAALGAVYMPHLFSIAHPAPLAIGDFLAVAGIWLFVEGRRDRRWYAPLAVVAGALLVTHHLSSYFFLVGAAGGLVLLELWRPGTWSTRFPARELVFLGGFAAALIAYWLVAAPEFVSALRTGLPALTPAWAAPAVVVVALGIVGLAGLVRWRRHTAGRRPSVRYPSSRSIGRDLALVAIATFAGILAVTVVPLPGTSQRTVLGAVVFFGPLLATIPLSAGSRRLVTFWRTGPFVVTWLAAVGISALGALVVPNQDLPAARSAEYLLLPLGLLVAVGVGHLLARWAVPRGRPALVAGGIAVALLVAANGAIAYPPPADLGGFQEGLTVGDATLWLWAGVGLPQWAAVASDHRLSSMLWGFDGNPATWDSTPGLFIGTDPSIAAAELRSSGAPHDPPRAIDAVAIDATMFTGTALDPGALAAPMSPAAIAWFGHPPFVPLYENGPEVVYWIDGPVGSVG